VVSPRDLAGDECILRRHIGRVFIEVGHGEGVVRIEVVVGSSRSLRVWRRLKIIWVSADARQIRLGSALEDA
jgi:hypothetical protein